MIAAGVEQLDHLVLGLQLGVFLQLRDVSHVHELARFVLEDERLLLQFEEEAGLNAAVVLDFSAHDIVLLGDSFHHKLIDGIEPHLLRLALDNRLVFNLIEAQELKRWVDVGRPDIFKKRKRRFIAEEDFPGLGINEENRVFLHAKELLKVRLLPTDHVVFDDLLNDVLLCEPGVHAEQPDQTYHAVKPLLEQLRALVVCECFTRVGGVGAIGRYLQLPKEKGEVQDRKTGQGLKECQAVDHKRTDQRRVLDQFCLRMGDVRVKLRQVVSEYQENHQQVHEGARNNSVHRPGVEEVAGHGLQQDDHHVVDRSQSRNDPRFAAQVGVPPKGVH